MSNLFSIINIKKIYPDIILHIIFIGCIVTLIYLPMKNKNSVSYPDYYYSRPHGLLADYYYYLAVINQGRSGLDETDPYTTEITKSSQVHIYYLVLGKIASLTNVSSTDIYYFGIYLPLIIYYVFTYLLVTLFFKGVFKWLTMALIFFTGPFPPWTIKIFNYSWYIGSVWWSNLDAYSRLTQVPHHFWSISSTVAGSYYFLRFFREQKIKWIVISGLIIVVSTLVFIPPTAVFFSSFLFSVFIYKILNPHAKIFSKIYLFGYSILALSFLIPLIWVYYQNSVLGFPWSANVTWEYNFWPEAYPNLLSIYLANLGIILPLSIIAIPIVLFRKKIDGLFIFCMTITPCILWMFSVWGILKVSKLRYIYAAPYVFGGILVIYTINYLYKKIANYHIKNIIILFTILVIGINSFISLNFYWRNSLELDPSYGNIYINNNYLLAINYLNQKAKFLISVYSDFYMGMLIPAFSNTKVYIGHEVSTYDFNKKMDETIKFYNGNLDPIIADKIFKTNNIDYVFWDKCYYPNAHQIYDKLLKNVFENNCVAIYKVNK